MKVYVATSFELWRYAQAVSLLLKQAGHTVMNTWTAEAKELGGDEHQAPNEEYRRRGAQKCLSAVKQSEVLLVLVPEEKITEGTCIEIGCALTAEVHVLLVGPGRKHTSFAWLCQQVDTIEQALWELS